MDAKKANESPESKFASMSLEEANSEVQPRRILKAQRASQAAQIPKVYQLSSFGKQPQAQDGSSQPLPQSNVTSALKSNSANLSDLSPHLKTSAMSSLSIKLN